ncbi:sigma-54 dependent transcriptional regulator [Xanthobacter sp. V3C-3]|uniref:sigma-54-dependent transcriptional regulator n=1 Tax=Xanthobacter lutulentifluminis TaxID=3119935 RepID=UPI00372C6C9C
MNPASILVVDDEAPFVRSLVYALKKEGLKPTGVNSCAAALDVVRSGQVDLALVDLRMPEVDGMETLARLRALSPDLPVIMVSAHGDTRAAVQAVKAGAVDYLTKPFELDDLLHCIRQALDRQRMHEEIEYHRSRQLSTASLIGDSPAMAALREAVERVAGSGTSRILVQGESGTGKALVARAIHAGSRRADAPFVEVNCAALPEQLIEAELFGAEKGAYTGAHQKRSGLVALAEGGTLFMDEIGEVPLALQAKLLHFLEDGTYRPVGAATVHVGNVRVVAATNRDLAALVREGRFREDLYYRLNVISVAVPALRERAGDTLVLARHFAARYAAQEGCAAVALAPETAALLEAHAWPGNVRELKNLIERLTILYPGATITPALLPQELRAPHAAPVAAAPAHRPEAGAAAGPATIDDRMDQAERNLLQEALSRSSGHKGRAAETLGISRHALKRRLQRLGL